MHFYWQLHPHWQWSCFQTFMIQFINNELHNHAFNTLFMCTRNSLPWLTEGGQGNIFECLDIEVFEIGKYLSNESCLYVCLPNSTTFCSSEYCRQSSALQSMSNKWQFITKIPKTSKINIKWHRKYKYTINKIGTSIVQLSLHHYPALTLIHISEVNTRPVTISCITRNPKRIC